MIKFNAKMTKNDAYNKPDDKISSLSYSGVGFGTGTGGSVGSGVGTGSVGVGTGSVGVGVGSGVGAGSTIFLSVVESLYSDVITEYSVVS